MTDAPERTWEPDAIYLTEMDGEDPDYPLVYASITERSGGSKYVRADLPPPLSAALELPEVRAMVEVGKRVHDLSCGDSSPAEWEVATLELRAALAALRGADHA